MLTVAADTAYPASTAGPRVRLAGYVPKLAEHGIDLRYRAALTDDEYALLSADHSSFSKARVLSRGALRVARMQRSAAFDLRLVHRLLSVAPLPGLDPPRRVDIYDFDDALFVGSISRANRRFGAIKREADRWRAYVRRAQLVIAGNPYLADAARKAGGTVEIVPSCVDPQRQPLRDHQDREIVTIGWIGSASTAPYLRELVPVVEKLNAAGPRVRFVAVGSGDSFSDPAIDARPWSLEREAADLASFDIGVMPMPDNPWTRGKCGYKALQYFAAGVPTVASPVGVATHLVSDERGLLAQTSSEWLAALDQLVREPSTRKSMGQAARSFVEADYSYARWAPEVAGMMYSLT